MPFGCDWPVLEDNTVTVTVPAPPAAPADPLTVLLAFADPLRASAPSRRLPSFDHPARQPVHGQGAPTRRSATRTGTGRTCPRTPAGRGAAQAGQRRPAETSSLIAQS